jgi:Xaa-Pro aminopeptidase
MTLCVESYIGEEGGKEGVKLEEQVLITETGVELLSQFPFEEALLR